MAPVLVEQGETVAAPPVPTMGGFTFAGWFREGVDTAFEFNTTPITENVILYADWTENTAV